MKDLTHPIEVLKTEAEKLKKHPMFIGNRKKGESEPNYEEQQYHLLKMKQVFQAIEELQKIYIKGRI